MRSVLLLLLCPCLAAATPEGYVALLLSRSPFCLIGETVTLGAAHGMAMVEGTYEYKYVPRFDHSLGAETIDFEYPVFVPADTDSLAAVTDTMQPKLRVGGVDFTPVDFSFWDDHAGVPLPFVPDTIKVVLLDFRVPRALLRERCSLALTYFQPTYEFAGREVVAYLPLLPDFEALKNDLLFSQLDFTVTVEAVDRSRLHRLSANAAIAEETPGKVAVHPAHREIIAVALEPDQAPAKPAAPAR